MTHVGVPGRPGSPQAFRGRMATADLLDHAQPGRRFEVVVLGAAGRQHHRTPGLDQGVQVA
ncbi:hypothetical protein OH807_01080 [Kitasatospora sp. NBC_01560]|uniref:hypothetical protein n=1 Tax=Kitasatospora sp. NBC_01560 TaxID=2975965 RepID=UPI00386A5AAA